MVETYILERFQTNRSCTFQYILAHVDWHQFWHLFQEVKWYDFLSLHTLHLESMS